MKIQETVDESHLYGWKFSPIINSHQSESISVNKKSGYSEPLNTYEFQEKPFVSPSEDVCLDRMSVSHLSTYRWSLVEELEAFREAQIPAIGLWRPKFYEWGEEAAFHNLRLSGLKVSSVSWAGGFTGSQGFSFNEAIQDSIETIKLAAKLNAKCVMVATGARFGHTRNHAHRLVVEGLKRLSDFAQDFNVSLAVVPMAVKQSRQWTYLTSLNQALEVIYHCNRKNVGLGIDSTLLKTEDLLLERIDQIAPLTKIVRLSDSDESEGRGLLSGCLPGEGLVPFNELISRFNKEGFNGYYEFEVRSEKMWQEAEYPQLLAACRDLFAQSSLV